MGSRGGSCACASDALSPSAVLGGLYPSGKGGGGGAGGSCTRSRFIAIMSITEQTINVGHLNEMQLIDSITLQINIIYSCLTSSVKNI